MRFVLILSVLLLPLTVSAQEVRETQEFDAGAFSILSIVAVPQFPEPGADVTLTAERQGLDLSDNVMTWQVDGKTIDSGVGAVSTHIVAPSIGKQTTVTLEARSQTGDVRTASITIAPSGIDLLIDADSYTPPFFRGRARGGVGSNVLAQAIAHIAKDAGEYQPSEIYFTWFYNGAPVRGLAGLGRSSASFPIQHLFGQNQISVEARAGGKVAARAVQVTPTEPLLVLYEDHPLYGKMYNHALSPKENVSESEMTFVAEPYFAPVLFASDPRLAYEWRVNNTRVEASATSSNALTINATGSSGAAYITLDVTHSTNYYLAMRGAWAITFETGGAGTNFFGR